MGCAHVARFTGQQRKDEERGPRLQEDMGAGTKGRRGTRGGPKARQQQREVGRGQRTTTKVTGGARRVLFLSVVH
eukprot:2775438-Pyramimonas_sp.AAC.1